ncbi:hypothetical protein B0H13DRAFT_1912416 [Mycena leptocephala]|nr:hypothetical protein B0H13DRAFT_1912416 [Mycena leptocephala]
MQQISLGSLPVPLPAASTASIWASNAPQGPDDSWCHALEELRMFPFPYTTVQRALLESILFWRYWYREGVPPPSYEDSRCQSRFLSPIPGTVQRALLEGMFFRRYWYREGGRFDPPPPYSQHPSPIQSTDPHDLGNISTFDDIATRAPFRQPYGDGVWLVAESNSFSGGRGQLDHPHSVYGHPLFHLGKTDVILSEYPALTNELGILGLWNGMFLSRTSCWKEGIVEEDLVTTGYVLDGAASLPTSQSYNLRWGFVEG